MDSVVLALLLPPPITTELTPLAVLTSPPVTLEEMALALLF
jgi:hypothetical protein